MQNKTNHLIGQYVETVSTDNNTRETMTKQHRNKAGITENAEMTKQEMNLWAKTKQVVIRMRQYQYSFSNVKQRTTLIYDKVHKIS